VELVTDLDELITVPPSGRSPPIFLWMMPSTASPAVKATSPASNGGVMNGDRQTRFAHACSFNGLRCTMAKSIGMGC